MKKFFTVLVILFAAAFVFAEETGYIVKFDTKDMKGNPVTSAIFAESKITMINIWGTFCGPCIREMPDLGKLAQENKKRGVQIIGIPIDVVDWRGNIVARTKADGDTIIEQTGANYIHLIPTRDMLNGFLNGVQVVPTTFFVDSTGKVVGKAYMGSTTKEAWQKIIDDLIK